MQLLIDAGNTRIKWAVAKPGPTGAGVAPEWLHINSVTHADIASLADTWRGMQFERVLISNVAGAAIRGQLTALLSGQSIDWFASQEHIGGLHNTYRNPAQLGCDRLAAMIGAHYLYPQQHLIIATCGTATTVDAVTADGEFKGGMILPGLKLMAESLARNTAQLPQVAESTGIDRIFADNTDHAIVSGCISAQVGAIEHAVSSFTRQQSQPLLCVISGGAAPYLTAHLRIPYQHIANLVLTGLFVVAQSSPG